MKANISICLAVMTGVLCATCHGGIQTQGQSGTQTIFQERYKAWCDWLRQNNVPGTSSIIYMDDLYSNGPFQEIVELGCSATPFIVEALQQDWRLEHALYLITKWKYNIERTGSRPAEYTWTVKEFPDMQSTTGLPDRKDVWRRWWRGARQETPRRFQAIYSEWHRLRSQGREEEAKREYQLLHDLGVAALPMMMSQIARGDAELTPMVSELTGGAVDPNANAQECLSWWQSNKDKWLIPFPNGGPTARAGEDRTVSCGDTVQLDASASSDPDGDELSYQWTQIAGPAVTLSDGTARNPTFVAPQVTQRTVLVFQLVVDDAADLSRAVPTPNSKSKPALVRITIDPQG